MRPPVFRGTFLADDELVVDSFAGGGGASTGQEQGLGRSPDIAINHSAAAIAMHRANHPKTKHYTEDIFDVDPREACAGRPVGLAWFSPDCTHFSRAKGTTPLKKEIRGLAWVVIRWAKEVKPRVIMLENVEEFQTWGPLGDDNRPDAGKTGDTFRQWLAELTDCGYRVEYRTLVAADYGTPTTRKRLFLIARCDGAPIVWPAPTHGKWLPSKWRAAAEIIDWSLPCPSIFDRKRPLAEATLRRIATGIRRYVIEASDPFIIPLTHQGGGRGRGIGDPLATVTGAHRGEMALVEPFIARTAHGEVDRRGKRRGRGQHDLQHPLPTVLGSNDFAVVEPFVVRHGHYSTRTGAGLREGCGAGTFRGQRLDAPLATVCATNDKHVVAPIITKHYGGVVGHGVERPLGTVTGVDHHSLTAAVMVKQNFGVKPCQGADEPLRTVTTQHNKFALTAAWLLKYHGGSARCHSPGEPLRTLDTSNRFAEVRAFLTKFYSAGGDASAQNMELFDPLHTVTTKARFGLVTIHGEQYEIADIGMRMLQPRELFAAQGFPDDYNITPWFNGKPLTKTLQTELAGNSVCPQVAAALVAANLRGSMEVAA